MIFLSEIANFVYTELKTNPNNLKINIIFILKRIKISDYG